MRALKLTSCSWCIFSVTWYTLLYMHDPRLMKFSCRTQLPQYNSLETVAEAAAELLICGTLSSDRSSAELMSSTSSDCARKQPVPVMWCDIGRVKNIQSPWLHRARHAFEWNTTSDLQLPFEYATAAPVNTITRTVMLGIQHIITLTISLCHCSTIERNDLLSSSVKGKLLLDNAVQSARLKEGRNN
ncbi:hypothetical protein BDR06DRAFT_953932 [Suillus hirtellus]|nr:hypothetical protein BDR06DRAFT_953932 [Suillus hirtellus]